MKTVHQLQSTVQCGCGHKIPKNTQLPYLCGCGFKIDVHETKCVSRSINDSGHRKAAICRSNKCGKYDETNDACQLVIEIGKQKGQNLAGKISWLYSNPDAECPHDPPMWSGDSNGDSMADGTGIA